MFKWVINTNIHTQSTIVMANLHPDNNSRSPMFADKTSSKWWRKKEKGEAGLASTYRNNTGANAELTMG